MFMSLVIVSCDVGLFKVKGYFNLNLHSHMCVC